MVDIFANMKMSKQYPKAREWAEATLNEALPAMGLDPKETIHDLSASLGGGLERFQSIMGKARLRFDGEQIDREQVRQLSLALRIVVHGSEMDRVGDRWFGPVVQVLHEWETNGYGRI